MQLRGGWGLEQVEGPCPSYCGGLACSMVGVEPHYSRPLHFWGCRPVPNSLAQRMDVGSKACQPRPDPRGSKAPVSYSLGPCLQAAQRDFLLFQR